MPSLSQDCLDKLNSFLDVIEIHQNGEGNAMKSEEVVSVYGNKTAISKTSRYGWKTKNEPGIFMEILKSDIKIPKEYQRTRRKKKVLDIARNWDWMACGALCVVYREDGRYYVVDGSHRKEAADKRLDIQKLPCLVFIGEEIGKEAESFLTINSIRSNMSVYEKFKARKIAGDLSVIECSMLINSTGHFFTDSASQFGVACIAAIENSFKKDEELTSKLWPICVDIHGKETIHGEIWKGLFYLVYVGGLDIDKHKHKLIQAGKLSCLQEINRSKILLNAGGEKTAAHGLLNIINYKRKYKVKINNFE